MQIVDISERPDLAQEYQVVAAPTLLRLLPLPVRRIVGDLSDRDRVLAGLEFEDTSIVVDDWPLTDGG